MTAPAKPTKAPTVAPTAPNTVGDPAVIRVVVSGDNITTTSDNQGNEFTYDHGFVKITCNGKPQDINLAEIARLSRAAALEEAEAAASDPSQEQEDFIKVSTPPRWKGIQLSLTASELAQPYDWKTLIGTDILPSQILNALSGIKSGELSLTFHDDVPSPLTSLCAKGQDTGMLRDRE